MPVQLDAALSVPPDLGRAPSSRSGARESRLMTREEKTRLNDLRALQYEMELKIKATQQVEKQLQELKVENEKSATELAASHRRLAATEMERDRLQDELRHAVARLGRFCAVACRPTRGHRARLLAVPWPCLRGAFVGE